MDDDLEAQAQGGDAEAQFRLGQMLLHGLGVAFDEAAGLEWYHRAAAQGYERAQFALGEVYKEGRVTPQDLIQASMWLSIVIQGGGDLAMAARESHDHLAPYLTPEQSHEAASRTGAWTPSS